MLVTSVQYIAVVTAAAEMLAINANCKKYIQAKEIHKTAIQKVNTTALSYGQCNKMHNVQLNDTKHKCTQLNAV